MMLCFTFPPLNFLGIVPAAIPTLPVVSNFAELIELVSIPLVGLGAYGIYKAAEWQRRNKTITGREGLLGAKGTVKRSLKPFGRQYRGKVLVFGEWWDAISDEPIQTGATIVVDAVEGFKLYVKELPDG